MPAPKPGSCVAQAKTKTQCRPWGELGEAKASERKGPMTCSALGQKFEILHHPLLHHRQLASGFKAQIHCLRLGGFTPKASFAHVISQATLPSFFLPSRCRYGAVFLVSTAGALDADMRD